MITVNKQALREYVDEQLDIEGNGVVVTDAQLDSFIGPIEGACEDFVCDYVCDMILDLTGGE